MSGYTNSFWDSRRGCELADTLIRCLPSLTTDKDVKIDELTKKVDELTFEVKNLTSLLTQIAEHYEK